MAESPPPCNQRGAEDIEQQAYDELSRDLASRVKLLRRRGAAALVIDLTDNGGGSEWNEVAARIVSPLRLSSARLGFVRGPHWANKWQSLQQELTEALEAAQPQDREKLRGWIRDVQRAQLEAQTPCSSEPFWTGVKPRCNWLGDGFYVTGLLGVGDAAALRATHWGPLVFSPARYDFEGRAWRGPLLVLVNERTASAAEEFAAVLQDNHAAIIIGSPTAGAGCGHTDGGTPTTLTHSGGTLQLPDCARFRRDGSNEVAGISPDVLIGFHQNDGAKQRARRVTVVLPQALEAAIRLCTKQACSAR